jgi:putative N6-adenine-specific DNA methylase
MRLIAKTLYGLEEILLDEVRGLGAINAKPLNRAVTFDGDKLLLYKANYSLRTALSVLRQIIDFRINSPEDLYKGTMDVDWGEYLNHASTFSIVSVVNSPVFKHSGYPALLVKDAIADWFRKLYGRRPSVNTENPDIVLNLHISNNQVNISIDSSVIPLFKRGYRKDQGPAPLNEVLAAGMVMLSGWDLKSSFIDPMCGSGTIPVEAALLASGIPPGRYRSYFGFQKWLDYDPGLFSSVKKKCDAGIISTSAKIDCSDISEYAVGIARRNIKSAGLSEIISVNRCDFRDRKKADESGLIIMNPPYGERIKLSDAELLYQMIGSVLKHNFHGYTAFLLTSDKEFLKWVGLKPKFKKTLFNGPLECILAKYVLYEGSVKNRPQ